MELDWETRELTTRCPARTGARPAPDPIAQLESVRAFLLSRVRNPADAQDLTQEVALRALPRLREQAAPAEVRSYLFRTARSVLADFWSDRLGHPTLELPDGSPSITVQAPPQEPEARVRTLLGGLGPDHRRVLELRFLLGLSLREAAAEMGRSEGAIKQLQLRALRAAATSSA